MPGSEGPRGEPGEPGCNGTKVQLQTLKKHFTTMRFFIFISLTNNLKQ